MLPSVLALSYKQYKDDTNSIANWLAITAKQCGYSADLLDSESTPQRTPASQRLKGKARKQARESDAGPGGATTTTGNDSTSKAPKHMIAVKDFISLAEFIVKTTKPRVEVPTSFASLLDRAIILRQRHNTWWYGQETEEETSDHAISNDRHNYFVGILEKVREVLRPRMRPDLLEDSLVRPAGTEGLDHGNLANIFRQLDVEEPSEAFLNATTASSPTQGSQQEAQYEAESLNDLEEVYLALHCLINDLQNIKKFIHEVWVGYKNRSFDLVAASITTNTAIDFARRMEEDFVKTFPKEAKIEKHMNTLYIFQCLLQGQDPNARYIEGDDMNFAMYDVAEELFFTVYLLLKAFSKVVSPRTIPSYKPGHYGTYDASSDRSRKSVREKFLEDKIVLLEILPDFSVLALAKGHRPGEDEMTRGIRDMIYSNEISLGLIFATRIFLDVHHIMRQDISRGFRDLRRDAHWITATLNTNFDFHQSLRIQNWPRQNDESLKHILRYIEIWVKGDSVKDMMIKMKCRILQEEPWHLMKQHPLFCGLFSYSMKILAQDAGIAFANAWGAVLHTAHLYNAVRQEGLMTESWEDMDLNICLHDFQHIFVGGFPDTPEDYFKRFCLAMGYSATNFAANRRRSAPAASREGPRSLNMLSPVSRMFRRRFVEGGRVDLSPQDIETILDRYLDDDEVDDEEGQSREGKHLLAIKVTGLKKSSKGSRTRLHPIQVLSVLLNTLQTETIELTFDHFSLHRACWRLLRMVKEKLDTDLRNMYGPGYLEVESQLPFVVGYIFMAATKSNRLGNLLKPKKEDVVTSRMLMKAGETLEGMIESGYGRLQIRFLGELFGFEIEIPDVFEKGEGGLVGVAAETSTSGAGG